MELRHINYPHEDLMPGIIRQRCFVEALGCKNTDHMTMIHLFLEILCKELNMVPMSTPMLQRVPILSQLGNNPDDYGVTASQTWMESGVMIHTWPTHGFVDINIETCKAFDPGKVGELVEEYFGTDQVQVTNFQVGI